MGILGERTAKPGVSSHLGASEPAPAEVDAQFPTPAYKETDKSFWDRIWPVIACGAGLFSDGYLNGVIGSVSTMLSTIYPKEYKASAAQRNVSSITFAGTVLGMLIFGWTSDHWSRKWSLLISTLILILFAALSAGSYGAHDSTYGLFAALTAFRFLLGIGIGGEHIPTSHYWQYQLTSNRRVSSWKCQLRREYWRAQVWHS